MKDPAFLFYSKDFYEGTRMMLPEERACYVDLLIYQHQNGVIPTDLRRVLMYCNGVDEATLVATLKAKFKETEDGWVNERLNDEVSARQNYKSGQSDSGKIGQFWKKAKKFLAKKDYDNLRKDFNDRDLVLEFVESNEITKGTLEGLLKHIVNANADVNKKQDKVIIPPREEFWSYVSKYIQENNLGSPESWKTVIAAKYNAWSEAGWKDGNGKNITNWKTKIQNTIPYLKPNGTTNNTNRPNSGKISTYQYAAQKLSEQSARNSESGNYTIDAEIVECEKP